MLRRLWKRPARHPIRRARLRLEQLESRDVPAPLGFDNAVPLSLVGEAAVSASLGANEQALYRIEAPVRGRFEATVASTGGEAAVELYTTAGELLVRSEPLAGQRAIDQHLEAGAYLLRVTARADISPISFDLTADLTPAIQPGIPLDTGSFSKDVRAPDLNGDGLTDLVRVGGSPGVSVLLGNGDGSFRPFVRADQRVPLALADLDGDGDLDVILADEARDQAAALTHQPVAAGAANTLVAAPSAFTLGAFRRDASGGLIGPGDVAVADVNGDGRDDLIFANTGSNNVLVYLRQADGSFADVALSFFAGTSPVDLHPTQLNDDNGDGVIDAADLLDLVVANQGSNDVSILLGSRNQDSNGDGLIDGRDLLELGPRLPTGGAGPNAVTTRDVTGDGIPDVLVTNGQSGTLATIPGLADVRGLATGAFDSSAIGQGHHLDRARAGARGVRLHDHRDGAGVQRRRPGGVRRER